MKQTLVEKLLSDPEGQSLVQKELAILKNESDVINKVDEIFDTSKDSIEAIEKIKAFKEIDNNALIVIVKQVICAFVYKQNSTKEQFAKDTKKYREKIVNQLI